MSESYNICLDVGGTKVLGAIFNDKKEIIYRLKKKSKGEGNSTQNVEKVIISVVEEMIEESGISKKDIHAISSSAPGVIDQKDGVVLFTPNLPWRNYDIRSSMEKKFGIPFYIGNDVNLGVLGEYKYGAARGYRNVVGFFVGTGMGDVCFLYRSHNRRQLRTYSESGRQHQMLWKKISTIPIPSKSPKEKRLK